MKTKLLSLVVGLPILCLGQSTSTGNQVANNATCSNTKIDAKGNVTFKCSGLSPDQAKILHDIPSLLNKIFRDQQRDSTAILTRLNGCVVGVQELKEGYWPNLTDKQINDLASMLPPSPNTKIDIVVPNGDDHNKVNLGKSLRSIFEKAQWSASISYNVTGRLARGLQDPTATIYLEIWTRVSTPPPISN